MRQLHLHQTAAARFGLNHIANPRHDHKKDPINTIVDL